MAARFFFGAALLASAFAAPSPVAVPQVQTNTASVNTTDNTPASTAEVTQATPSPSALGGNTAKYFHGPAWLPAGEKLVNALTQEETNGNSVLGTSKAPKLPHWLGGPATPWGSRTAKNTNFYDINAIPVTGVTRKYDFTISQAWIAPDGVNRSSMLINGAFPAPTIEANWGDWIEVTVHNELACGEGTTLHWHGLLQQQTPWFDGVPAVQQCPITAGTSFTYQFRADLYGTSWYHAHYSAQYAAGLYGAMIIYGPHDNAEYDEDLGPVILNDWYHTYYFDLIEQVMAPASEGLLPPLSNNNMINGKANYPCQNATAGEQCTPNAGISKFFFESGKRYRLRLINAGAEGIQKFSIDGYKLTVIANDFVPIEPYQVDVVTLGVGQRSDIIVEATGKPTDAVWMRSTLGPSAFVGGCTLNDGISPEAVAAIYYENANTSAVPTTNSIISSSELTTCANDDLSLTTPYYPLTPPAKPHTSQNINITFQSNGTNDLFYMNNSTFRADYNAPVLLDVKEGRKTFPAEWNVYDFGSSPSIRLVVYNYAAAGAHPMHMHGHNMYILAVGTGEWDGVATLPKNPQRRDVQLLPNAVSTTEPGYIVVQFDANNPGVWPFHCHIAWHVSAGLYINILENPAAIRSSRMIPASAYQTCNRWGGWTDNNVPDEIDSGL